MTTILAAMGHGVMAARYKLAYETEGEAGFKALDEEYTNTFKSMTQDQRKKALHVLNSGKYANPGNVSWSLKTTRGEGLLKSISRGIQNLCGTRISSKMVQHALHEWVKQ